MWLLLGNNQYSCQFTGLVPRRAVLPPDHRRIELELGWRDKSQLWGWQTCYQKYPQEWLLLSPLVEGARCRTTGKWGQSQDHREMGLFWSIDKTTMCTATGAQASLPVLGLQQCFLTSYLDPKALIKALLSRDAFHIFFCGGTWAGYLQIIPLYCWHYSSLFLKYLLNIFCNRLRFHAIQIKFYCIK